MSNRPPFDPLRASFYLIAFVIAIYAIVILAGVTTCIVYASEIIQGTFECDKNNKLLELLTAALAAALAFSGLSKK